MRRELELFRLSGVVGILIATSFAQGVTQRVSVDSEGDQGDGHSLYPSFSADGRYVLFESWAKNLAARDSNQSSDVFLHDRLTGAMVRVSENAAGVPGNGGSFGGSMSADCRFVAFESDSTNLVAGDTNSYRDIFVRDLALGQVARVSLAYSGGQTNDDSHDPSLSGDGRYVAFYSHADGIVALDQNGMVDVFVHDRQTGQTVRASQTPAGIEGDGDSHDPEFSADGHFVVFVCPTSRFVSGDNNGVPDVFVWERLTGQLTCPSVTPSGTTGNGQSGRPSISGDGRYVAFESRASDLVSGDTNADWDVFVRDRVTGQTTRESVDSAGVQAQGLSYLARISADARFLSFSSFASNVVPGDTNDQIDVFARDRQSGQVSRVSLDSAGGQGNGMSGYGGSCISVDGRLVAFETTSTNLVAGDTNGKMDVIVRDRFGCAPIVAGYCAAGTTSHGCTASLTTSGVPSASAGSGFVVGASGLDGQQTGIFFFGTHGSLEVPWGGSSSFACVRPPFARTSPSSTGGTQSACDGALSLDWNQYLAAHSTPFGASFIGGETVWIQAWCRDAGSPSGGSLSAALWFQVCP